MPSFNTTVGSNVSGPDANSADVYYAEIIYTHPSTGAVTTYNKVFQEMGKYAQRLGHDPYWVNSAHPAEVLAAFDALSVASYIELDGVRIPSHAIRSLELKTVPIALVIDGTEINWQIVAA